MSCGGESQPQRRAASASLDQHSFTSPTRSRTPTSSPCSSGVFMRLGSAHTHPREPSPTLTHSGGKSPPDEAPPSPHATARASSAPLLPAVSRPKATAPLQHIAAGVALTPSALPTPAGLTASSSDPSPLLMSAHAAHKRATAAFSNSISDGVVEEIGATTRINASTAPAAGSTAQLACVDLRGLQDTADEIQHSPDASTTAMRVQPHVRHRHLQQQQQQQQQQHHLAAPPFPSSPLLRPCLSLATAPVALQGVPPPQRRAASYPSPPPQATSTFLTSVGPDATHSRVSRQTHDLAAAPTRAEAWWAAPAHGRAAPSDATPRTPTTDPAAPPRGPSPPRPSPSPPPRPVSAAPAAARDDAQPSQQQEVRRRSPPALPDLSWMVPVCLRRTSELDTADAPPLPPAAAAAAAILSTDDAGTATARGDGEAERRVHGAAPETTTLAAAAESVEGRTAAIADATCSVSKPAVSLDLSALWWPLEIESPQPPRRRHSLPMLHSNSDLTHSLTWPVHLQHVGVPKVTGAAAEEAHGRPASAAAAVRDTGGGRARSSTPSPLHITTPTSVPQLPHFIQPPAASSPASTFPATTAAAAAAPSQRHGAEDEFVLRALGGPPKPPLPSVPPPSTALAAATRRRATAVAPTEPEWLFAVVRSTVPLSPRSTAATTGSSMGEMLDTELPTVRAGLVTPPPPPPPPLSGLARLSGAARAEGGVSAASCSNLQTAASSRGPRGSTSTLFARSLHGPMRSAGESSSGTSAAALAAATIKAAQSPLSGAEGSNCISTSFAPRPSLSFEASERFSLNAQESFRVGLASMHTGTLSLTAHNTMATAATTASTTASFTPSPLQLPSVMPTWPGDTCAPAEAPQNSGASTGAGGDAAAAVSALAVAEEAPELLLTAVGDEFELTRQPTSRPDWRLERAVQPYVDEAVVEEHSTGSLRAAEEMSSLRSSPSPLPPSVAL